MGVMVKRPQTFGHMVQALDKLFPCTERNLSGNCSLTCGLNEADAFVDEQWDRSIW